MSSSRSSASTRIARAASISSPVTASSGTRHHLTGGVGVGRGRGRTSRSPFSSDAQIKRMRSSRQATAPAPWVDAPVQEPRPVARSFRPEEDSLAGGDRPRQIGDDLARASTSSPSVIASSRAETNRSRQETAARPGVTIMGCCPRDPMMNRASLLVRVLTGSTWRHCRLEGASRAALVLLRRFVAACGA